MSPPVFSASLGWALIDTTPAHVHATLTGEAKEAESDVMDLGTIVDGCLLDGEANVALIDAPDWRTKAAREARDAARLAGKTPLLAHKWGDVQAMVRAARIQLERHELPTPFMGGYTKNSMFFDLDGVACRATPDWLSTDRRLIVDLKTTSASAHPAIWSRTMWSNGCSFQAGFYRRAVKTVFGTDPDFRFIVAETYPPYALASIALDPEGLAFVDQQVDEALRIWKRCLDSGQWPGYPQRVCYAEPPPWLLAQWAEREYFHELSR